jgi:hypothetical protein
VVVTNDLARAITIFAQGLGADHAGQNCPEFHCAMRSGTPRHLGAGVRFTPDRQFSTRRFGPFAHAGESVVPAEPSGVQDRRGNALSVIHDVQPKLPWVIADLHFDPPIYTKAQAIKVGGQGNL